MKLVSPESLNPDQAQILREYSLAFPAGAVCVNVMLGSQPWDLRPLLLIGGKVSLARFSMELGEAKAKRVAAELEGYAVLFKSQQRITLLPGSGRFMVLRPFFTNTLRDDLEKGEVVGDKALTLLVRDLIRIVSDLSRRSLAHGHISPSNLTREGDKLQLIDPIIGALHKSEDTYLPPESELGEVPEPTADLYGLGSMIRILLADRLTQRQERLVEQLLLPAARQRPSLVEVAIAFGVRDSNVIDAKPDSKASSERVAKRSVREDLAGGKGQVHAGSFDSEELEDSGGASRHKKSSLGSNLLLLGAVGAIGALFIYQRYPELYYRAASYFPALAPTYSADYETSWVSGEKAKMSVVARAAALRGEPAAINTILGDVLGGANPQGVRGAFLRVAFDQEWRDELSDNDRKVAIGLGLDQLVPEVRGQSPDSASLHPGVLLAILGQLPAKGIPSQVRQLSVDRLLALPEPFKGLFSQLKEVGAKTLGEPRVAALAGIVTGSSGVDNLDQFIGKESSAAQTLASISLIAPILSANQDAARDLLGLLTERGGELGSLVGWFDLLDLALWSKVSPSVKLSLILGELPEQGLSSVQLTDLLSFPMEQVRSKALLKVRGSFSDRDAEKVLVTVTSPACGLTREQVIALISALQLAPEARTPYITAWFELNPPADTVLLLLLARASADGNDLFNLEATRYLKRSEFKANLDTLKLLAVHPEPLARVLAYNNLDPSDQAQRSLLLERKLHEKEPACLTVLEGRLSATRSKL